MKIMFILPFPIGTMGSTSSFLISRELAYLGHKVVMVSPIKDNNATQPFDKRDLRTIQKFEYDPKSSKIRIIKDIFETIKQHKPDVVHVVFRRWSFLYPVVCKLLRNHHAKWVVDIRSPLVSSGLRRVLGRSIGPLEQLGYDAVAGASDATIRDVISVLRKPKYSIPLVIQTENFHDHERLKHDETDTFKAKKFVYIGSLSRTRGIDRLIQAFKFAYEYLGNDAVLSLDIFGTGASEEDLKKYIAMNHLSRVVFLRGVISYKELAKRLTEYDVGLAYIPYNNYYDSPALKTLEYMAAGLLVIASDTSGNKMFVKNYHNGILIPNEVAVWTEAIVKAVNVGFPCILRLNACSIVKRYDSNLVVRSQVTTMYDELITGLIDH